MNKKVLNYLNNKEEANYTILDNIIFFYAKGHHTFRALQSLGYKVVRVMITR